MCSDKKENVPSLAQEFVASLNPEQRQLLSRYLDSVTFERGDSASSTTALAARKPLYFVVSDTHVRAIYKASHGAFVVKWQKDGLGPISFRYWYAVDPTTPETLFSAAFWSTDKWVVGHCAASEGYTRKAEDLISDYFRPYVRDELTEALKIDDAMRLDRATWLAMSLTGRVFSIQRDGTRGR